MQISDDEYSADIRAVVTKLNCNRKYQNVKKDDNHKSILNKVLDYFQIIFKNDQFDGCVGVITNSSNRKDQKQQATYDKYFKNYTLREYHVYIRDYYFNIYIHQYSNRVPQVQDQSEIVKAQYAEINQLTRENQVLQDKNFKENLGTFVTIKKLEQKKVANRMIQNDRKELQEQLKKEQESNILQQDSMKQDYENHKEQLESKLRELQNDKDQLTKKLEEFQLEMKNKGENCKELKDKQSQKTNELCELLLDVKTISENYLVLQNKFQSQGSQLESARLELSKKSEEFLIEIKTKEDNCQQLQKMLHDQTSELKSKIQELTIENSILKEENVIEQTKIFETFGQIDSDTVNEIGSLKVQIQNQEREKNNLFETLNLQSEKICSLKKEILSLQTQLRDRDVEQDLKQSYFIIA